MPRRIPTQAAVTIQLSTISTPAEQLLSVQPGPVKQDVLARAEERGWHRIPVLTDDGDLAGLVPAKKLRALLGSGEPIDAAKAELTVPELPGKVRVPVLLEAIRDHHAVIHRADPDEDRPDQWFALITPVDLNRPMFRASVYTIIALLETSFGELLSEEFDDDWSAIRLLGAGTEERVREYWEEQKDDGLDLSPIARITLSDMFHIAAESRNVWRLLGYDSPKALRPIGHDINDIRNRIMHPIRPLVPHERDVALVLEAVEHMIAITKEIQRQVPAMSQADGAASP